MYALFQVTFSFIAFLLIVGATLAVAAVCLIGWLLGRGLEALARV